jgi:hypothetical protein
MAFNPCWVHEGRSAVTALHTNTNGSGVDALAISARNRVAVFLEERTLLGFLARQMHRRAGFYSTREPEAVTS